MRAYLHIAGLAAWALLPLAADAQGAAAPWISALPGVEHPAIWTMSDRPVTMGVQTQSRWNGNGPPLQATWLAAGWQPSSGKAGRYRNSMPSGFGLTASDDMAAGGWRRRHAALAFSTASALNRDWKASAGLSLGVDQWLLDPANWAWNAQYGAGGYNPAAPSGEQNASTTSGTRILAAAGIGLTRIQRSAGNTGSNTRAALTLHHIAQGPMPHLSPEQPDTTRWKYTWWLETGGALDWGDLSWRAWHRGALQGAGKLLEGGVVLGRAFGSTARFTKTQLSHHLETGLLWRSDGVLRMVIGWRRDGLALTTGPGWSIGTLWRPPPGWCLALTWAPDMEGRFALSR